MKHISLRHFDRSGRYVTMIKNQHLDFDQVDFKTSPLKVLEIIDSRLASYGLAIAVGDCGDDQCYFAIYQDKK